MKQLSLLTQVNNNIGIDTYRLLSTFSCLKNLNGSASIQTKHDDVFSIGRCEWCVHRSGTDKAVGSYNRIGVGVKFNDSDGIGNSSTAMASALSFGGFTLNRDVFGSVFSAFESIGTFESASAADLGTGIKMAIHGRVDNVIDTVELYQSIGGEKERQSEVSRMH